MNLSLCRSKKDLCDACCGHEAGTIPETEYAQHIKPKDEARASKETDKERTKIQKYLKVLTQVASTTK